MSEPSKEDWESRCDWCGWPIEASTDKGCVWDNCSMRPLPKISEVGERQQRIRRLEAHAAKVRKEVAEECARISKEQESLGFSSYSGRSGMGSIPCGCQDQIELTIRRRFGLGDGDNVKSETLAEALELLGCSIDENGYIRRKET